MTLFTWGDKTKKIGDKLKIIVDKQPKIGDKPEKIGDKNQNKAPNISWRPKFPILKPNEPSFQAIPKIKLRIFRENYLNLGLGGQNNNQKSRKPRGHSKNP